MATLREGMKVSIYPLTPGMHSLTEQHVPADEHTSSPQVPSLRVTAGSVMSLWVWTQVQKLPCPQPSMLASIPWKPSVFCPTAPYLPPSLGDHSSSLFPPLGLFNDYLLDEYNLLLILLSKLKTL